MWRGWIIAEPAEDEFDIPACNGGVGGRISDAEKGSEFGEGETAVGVEGADDDCLDAVGIAPEIPVGKGIVEGGWEERVVGDLSCLGPFQLIQYLIHLFVGDEIVIPH